MPICRFGGLVNHKFRNAVLAAARVAEERSPFSMKITDSPGAMLVIPVIGTALPNKWELSSTFQPAMFCVTVPMFVTSNQSEPSWLLPLDQGATSEMMSVDDKLAPAVTVNVYGALASGFGPSVGSSTFTMMEYPDFAAAFNGVPALRNRPVPMI